MTKNSKINIADTNDDINSMDTDSEESFSNFIFLIPIFVFLIWFLVFMILWGYPITAPEFGDAFGALNTLFSGLAFAGVVYAIILQQKSLKTQKEELDKSITAQEKQAVIQTTATHLQALIMLQEHHSKIVSTLKNEDKQESAVSVTSILAERQIKDISVVAAQMYYEEIMLIERNLNINPSKNRKAYMELLSIYTSKDFIENRINEIRTELLHADTE